MKVKLTERTQSTCDLIRTNFARGFTFGHASADSLIVSMLSGHDYSRPTTDHATKERTVSYDPSPENESERRRRLTSNAKYADTVNRLAEHFECWSRYEIADGELRIRIADRTEARLKEALSDKK